MKITTRGGLIGIILVLFFSMALTPAICDSIRQKNIEVSCSGSENLDIFSRIYLNPYFVLLVLFGFLSGVFIAKTIGFVSSENIVSKKFLYPWEN